MFFFVQPCIDQIFTDNTIDNTMIYIQIIVIKPLPIQYMIYYIYNT